MASAQLQSSNSSSPTQHRKPSLSSSVSSQGPLGSAQALRTYSHTGIRPELAPLHSQSERPVTGERRTSGSQLSGSSLSRWRSQDTVERAVMIYGLPNNITERELKSLLVFSTDLVRCHIAPNGSSGPHKTGVAFFNSAAGAQHAQRELDGKPNPDGTGKLIVRTLSDESSMESTLVRRNTHAGATHSSFDGSPFKSTASSHGGSYSSIDQMSPPNSAPADMPGGARTSLEFPSPEVNARYQNYGSTSPVRERQAEPRQHELRPNYYLDQPEIIPGGEMNRGYTHEPPPQVIYTHSAGMMEAMSGMANLSIGNVSTSPMGYGPQRSPAPNYTMSSIPTPMTPGSFGHMLDSPNPRSHVPFKHNTHIVYPPINPADQNEPCNTLYVGNLPMNTSEDELKALFSRQRGYKRLCFRTKSNGPMCFVEFDDVSYATRALNELYGHPLSNSIKGGIRLSFSKNPLGVRSGQHPARSVSPMSFGSHGMANLPTPQTPGFPLVQAPPGLASPGYPAVPEPSMLSAQMSPYAAPFGMMSRQRPQQGLMADSHHPMAIGPIASPGEMSAALMTPSRPGAGMVYMSQAHPTYPRNLPGD